ncbi:ribosome recycling factor [Patescibacteria group bacterium]|nr:ribosome recycling factor [Patescibacteria group bacterium]
MDILNLKQEFEKSIQQFKEELKGVRVGRASTQLVENLEIEYYGARAPLKQAAQISTPDAKTIMISPWNKDDLVNIEKAVNESDLNLAPNNDGAAIYLKLPPMTEERRDELVKIVGSVAEECRVNIRQKREKVLDQLNQGKKNNSISEDEFFKTKEDIQKLVDEFTKQIDQIKENKEQEIKTL